MTRRQLLEAIAAGARGIAVRNTTMHAARQRPTATTSRDRGGRRHAAALSRLGHGASDPVPGAVGDDVRVVGLPPGVAERCGLPLHRLRSPRPWPIGRAGRRLRFRHARRRCADRDHGAGSARRLAGRPFGGRGRSGALPVAPPRSADSPGGAHRHDHTGHDQAAGQPGRNRAGGARTRTPGSRARPRRHHRRRGAGVLWRAAQRRVHSHAGRMDTKHRRRLLAQGDARSASSDDVHRLPARICDTSRCQRC